MTNPIAEAAACLIIGCLFPVIVVVIVALMISEACLSVAVS